MRAMEGVRYLTDETGKRVAVQLDLEIFGEVWEDLEDALVAMSRGNDENIPFDELCADLIESGKLREPVPTGD
jgi:hypothetical protein